MNMIECCGSICCTGEDGCICDDESRCGRCKLCERHCECPGTKATVTSVATAIGRYRFRSQKEKLLQEAIARALGQERFDFKREVEVAPGSVIDFLVGDVGIEVKISGSSTAVLRQIMRYLESDQVKSLVLVTVFPRPSSSARSRNPFRR